MSDLSHYTFFFQLRASSQGRSAPILLSSIFDLYNLQSSKLQSYAPHVRTTLQTFDSFYYLFFFSCNLYLTPLILTPSVMIPSHNIFGRFVSIMLSSIHRCRRHLSVSNKILFTPKATLLESKPCRSFSLQQNCSVSHPKKQLPKS